MSIPLDRDLTPQQRQYAKTILKAALTRVVVHLGGHLSNVDFADLALHVTSAILDEDRASRSRAAGRRGDHRR